MKVASLNGITNYYLNRCVKHGCMVLCVTVRVCNHKFFFCFFLYFIALICKDWIYKYGLDCMWMYMNNNCAYCPMFKNIMLVRGHSKNNFRGN